MRENDGDPATNRILDLGHVIGVAHQVNDGFAGGPGIDGCAIAYRPGGLSLPVEFAAYLHLNVDDFDLALTCLTINIVAIAGSQREEE